MDPRPALTEAIERQWARLARPGTWWTGAERVDIALEVRASARCRLCADRLEALSPASVAGAHLSVTELPAAVVEAAHRIATDPARLSEGWFRALLSERFDEARYVELVGVVAIVLAVDAFDRASGRPPRPLPTPVAGAPSRRAPAGARRDRAWVRTLAPEDVTADDPPLYEGRSAANIHRAMSLVPDEVVGFFDLDNEMYLPDRWLRDWGTEYRALSHAQIELLAARMSALNRCVY
ncbi:MAG: hypothetical protein FJX02_08910 [Alphaproteobacteria bacterium]|nr:hypothetical protein [Alphaproteobacteria bacterium]